MKCSYLLCLGLLVGCIDEASDAMPRLDAARDAGADADALALAKPDVTDATADIGRDSARLEPDVDPCVVGDIRAQAFVGPAQQDVFIPWTPPASIPLIRLAQGGSVARFDVLVVGVGAEVLGITVSITDLDDGQELAFGRSGADSLPCRPAVGRLSTNRAIDFGADFPADDLAGRRVLLAITIDTPAGAVHGGVEGVIE